MEIQRQYVDHKRERLIRINTEQEVERREIEREIRRDAEKVVKRRVREEVLIRYFSENFNEVTNHVKDVKALLDANSSMNSKLRSHIRVTLLTTLNKYYDYLQYNERSFVLSILKSLTKEEAIKFYEDTIGNSRSDYFSNIQHIPNETAKKLMQYVCDNIAYMISGGSVQYINLNLGLFASKVDRDVEKLEILRNVLQSNIETAQSQLRVEQTSQVQNEVILQQLNQKIGSLKGYLNQLNN